MARIELKAIANRVLKGIDLAIPCGEFFVLLGPSGAGKTSLLNVAAGLMPHKGRVLFDGRNMNRVPPQKRRVGYVFQDLLLFPHLSVEGNLGLAMGNRPGGAAEKGRRCQELMEMLKITHLAGRRPDGLSGGERQRVALARALAPAPRILLLDEPFNNLDFRSARRLRAELKKMQKRLGLTTIFVTHNLDEAKELADRMAVVRRGRLDEVGAPRELFDNRNGAESSFLERVNVLKVRDKKPLGRGLAEFTWAGEPLVALDEGLGGAELAVLPSRVHLGRKPVAGPEVNRFVGTISRVMQTDSIWQVQVDVRGEALAADIPWAGWKDAPMEPGERVHVLIKLGDLKMVC